jgi:hypothetical protein
MPTNSPTTVEHYKGRLGTKNTKEPNKNRRREKADLKQALT